MPDPFYYITKTADRTLLVECIDTLSSAYEMLMYLPLILASSKFFLTPFGLFAILKPPQQIQGIGLVSAIKIVLGSRRQKDGCWFGITYEVYLGFLGSVKHDTAFFYD